ncbi:Outer membrane porin protein 32 [Burkholderiaceae bacterium]|nr:Outer membrane porin protein 32 [Burkholderiaceae bacterium]
MKKSLLALAVLGAFAGAATAQSSVTIYGSVDLAVAKSNGGTAGNNGGPAGASKAWTLQQSNGNRLGFRGNEDLGGGLSAQFQIEHRFTADDGNAANPFWAGRSYVQLTSASAGSLYLGREYTPAFWPAVKSDPFGWDGVGQLGSYMWAGYLSPANPNGGVRSSNTVGYKSPKMGGLTFNGAVGLSETTGAGRNNGFNVEYGAGPIYAAMGYEKITDGAADGQGVVNFALHYDFGMAKVMGYFAKANILAGGDTDSKFYSIAALAPMGSGNLKVAYGRLDADVDAVDRKKFAIGYDHRLSKRTNVYADLGLTRAPGRTNNNTFALGVKHTF